MICDSIFGMRDLESCIVIVDDRCASLLDGRFGRNAKYAVRDIGLVAFSVFPTRSLSFCRTGVSLSADRGTSNARTLFSMGSILCDNYIRQMSDDVPPEHFDGVFSAIVADPGGRGAIGDVMSGRRCIGGVGLSAAFPVPQAALRLVPDAPCGRQGGVFPQLRLCVVDRTRPKPGPAVGAGVRASLVFRI